MPTARCFAPGNNHYNNLVIGGKVTEAGNCILQPLEGIGVELCDKRGIGVSNICCSQNKGEGDEIGLYEARV